MLMRPEISIGRGYRGGALGVGPTVDLACGTGGHTIADMTTSPPQDRPVRVRVVAHAVVLWLFGLATTVLLIGLWGRAVSVDEATLAESAKAVLESGYVKERVLDWVESGADGVATTPAARTVEAALADPAVQASLDRVVDDLVGAALVPPGVVEPVDLSASLADLVPAIADALDRNGVDVDAEALESALAGSSILLTDDGGAIGAGSATRAKAFLTRVVVVAVAGMVVGAGLALALAQDRLRQVRSLLVRLAVSAATFAIVLRVGAWAVDPRGGRSPLGTGGAILLSSNGHVALVLGGAAVVAAAVVTLMIHRRRMAGGDPDAAAAPVEDHEFVSAS
jgi:hypothetical protein